MRFNIISWRTHLLLFLLFACIATALLSSLASNTQIPQITDIANHLAAIMQAKMALAEGQFPLRIAPLEQDGWRYPLFQFYSPSSYTFAGLILSWLPISNPFVAYKITIWCALVTGGVYMYRLADWFVGSRPAAIIASVAYLTAPYYMIVINHIGGFNEAIALGILPAALYYTLRRYYHIANDIVLLQTALAWYLLATVHLITFFYTSLFVAGLLVLITCKTLAHWKNLISVGLAYVFGCLLAMWYLAPIGLLAKYFVVSRTFNSSALAISTHTANLSSLLSPAVNINSGVDIASMIHPSLGMPIVMAIGIAIYVIVNKLTTESARSRFWFSSLVILFLIAFFMAWTPINFWQWLPEHFMIAQYSWRLLAQTMWTGALLLAWALCWLFENKLDARHIVLGIFLIVLSTSNWLPVFERSYITLTDIIQHPLLQSDKDSYLINPKKSPQFVNVIDNASLDDRFNQNPAARYTLKLNIPQPIPRALLDATITPVISLQANVSDKINDNDQKLLALINGSVIATHPLKTGVLHWDIPLSAIVKSTKKIPLFLEFQIRKNPRDKSIPTILLQKIVLKGFLNATTTLTAAEVKPHCREEKANIICEIDTHAGMQLIELPIIYYPDLLNITVNGKTTPYEGVLSEYRLIAGIKPEAGKTNSINIQFRGLLWANFVSATTWGLWVLFFVFVVMQTIFPKKKSLPCH